MFLPSHLCINIAICINFNINITNNNNIPSVNSIPPIALHQPMHVLNLPFSHSPKHQHPTHLSNVWISYELSSDFILIFHFNDHNHHVMAKGLGPLQGMINVVKCSRRECSEHFVPDIEQPCLVLLHQTADFRYSIAIIIITIVNNQYQ